VSHLNHLRRIGFACSLESHGFSTLRPQLSDSRLTCNSLIWAKKIPVRL
jgi:hypothetical protein